MLLTYYNVCSAPGMLLLGKRALRRVDVYMHTMTVMYMFTKLHDSVSEYGGSYEIRRKEMKTIN